MYVKVAAAISVKIVITRTSELTPNIVNAQRFEEVACNDKPLGIIRRLNIDNYHQRNRYNWWLKKYLSWMMMKRRVISWK